MCCMYNRRVFRIFPRGGGGYDFINMTTTTPKSRFKLFIRRISCSSLGGFKEFIPILAI